MAISSATHSPEFLLKFDGPLEIRLIFSFFAPLIANQATLKDYELDVVVFVSSSGEAARVATERKTLLLCSAALHLPSHPPICLCVFTHKNKTC